jgi:long-chain acyl-CoA synthetase
MLSDEDAGFHLCRDAEMTDINNEMTVLKYLHQHAVNKPDEPCLVDRKGGEDIVYSFKDTADIVEATAKSLASLFADKATKISILAKNRAHWAMCDLGVLRSGNILAPVFATMPPATFRYAMEFSDIKLLFVGEAGNWDTVKSEVPEHVKIVSLPGVALEEADYTFDEFLSLGIDTPLPEHPDAEAPCTIVFTSGTTGLPKGVVHSLKTIDAFVSAVCTYTGQQTRFFSYLPLAHLGDRAAIVFHSIQAGGRLTFNASLETFTDDLKAASPTLFMGVPRIWEKLQQGVLLKIGVDLPTLKTKLAETGGQKLAQQIRTGLGLQNIDILLTATAPTSNSVKQWYASLEMPLHDIYGQTEAGAVTGSSAASDGSTGVGQILPGFKVRIADNGEILCTGPSRALGYYNSPEKTAEAFVDGWVHTGDKGLFDEQGNLHITGRVQDTFKTAKGKYVAPVPIEDAFSRSACVEQQCLYGFGLTQPIMLCNLSETAPTDSGVLEQELTIFTQGVNEQLEPHERIGGIIICKTPWSAENGVLTHTLKVKRASVAERYQDVIKEMAEAISGAERSIKILWV